MPFSYKLLPISLTKNQRFFKVFLLHALILHEFYHRFQSNFCSSVTILNMHMNGRMIVRIKPEAKTKYGQQCRHNSHTFIR